MGTLAEFRGWLRKDLNDPAGTEQRFGDADLDRAMTRAVAEFSEVWPREADTDHTIGAASRTLDLSGAPYAGVLVGVSEVEYPYGAAGVEATFPPSLVSFRLSADRTKLLMLSREVPASGQVARVRWTAAHSVTEGAATVPVEWDWLLVLGAAGYAMLGYSTPAADNFVFRDQQTAGDVDDTAIPREWRVRGQARLEEFRRELERLQQRRALSGRPWVSWGRSPAAPQWPGSQLDGGREP